MVHTTVRVRSVVEAKPGPRWQALCREFWPSYRGWLETTALPSFSLSECRGALDLYMPELVPSYHALLALGPADPLFARFLTGYSPPAFPVGCCQIAMPQLSLLARNYDYEPERWEGLILQSAWCRPVLGTSDCLWGLLDGVNDSGLVVSLAFGGGKAAGPGFGMPLILRYILETAHTTAHAIAALQRIPSHMSYNVSILDALCHSATVEVYAGGGTRVSDVACATNHQHIDVRDAEHEDSVFRLRALNALATSATGPTSIGDALLTPPLFRTGYERAKGTLYTVLYDAQAQSARFLWPRSELFVVLGRFAESERTVVYGA